MMALRDIPKFRTIANAIVSIDDARKLGVQTDSTRLTFTECHDCSESENESSLTTPKALDADPFVSALRRGPLKAPSPKHQASR